MYCYRVYFVMGLTFYSIFKSVVIKRTIFNLIYRLVLFYFALSFFVFPFVKVGKIKHYRHASKRNKGIHIYNSFYSFLEFTIYHNYEKTSAIFNGSMWNNSNGTN